VGDVGVDELGVTAGLADSLRRILSAVGVDVAGHDPGALGGEQQRGGPADAQRRAGDERGLSAQPVRH
jgi:hypothetical protein